MAIRGIDVASYQSEHPSLSGVDFVFVKATEGTGYVNPKMRAQADWARSHGRVVGFYAFLRPGSMTAQARYFVDKCVSRPGDPLWADWEDPGVSCADKDAFLREVVRLRGDTHRVGLYCNTNFWTHRDTTSYAADALWIAVYNGRPGRPGIRHPWLFHQYTSTPIDTSLAAFSTRDALRTWCTKTATAEAASKEDDMPSAKEVAEEVYDLLMSRDGVPVPADWGAPGNDHWKWPSIIASDGDRQRRIERKLDVQAAVIDKLVDAVGAAGQFDPAGLKEEIRQAIESVTVHLDTDTPKEN